MKTFKIKMKWDELSGVSKQSLGQTKNGDVIELRLLGVTVTSSEISRLKECNIQITEYFKLCRERDQAVSPHSNC